MLLRCPNFCVWRLYNYMVIPALLYSQVPNTDSVRLHDTGLQVPMTPPSSYYRLQGRVMGPLLMWSFQIASSELLQNTVKYCRCVRKRCNTPSWCVLLAYVCSLTHERTFAMVRVVICKQYCQLVATNHLHHLRHLTNSMTDQTGDQFMESAMRHRHVHASPVKGCHERVIFHCHSMQPEMTTQTHIRRD